MLWSLLSLPEKTGKLKKEMRITNRSYANPDNESLPDKFHPKLSTGARSREKPNGAIGKE
jgi:hypothetical protein